MLAYPGISRYKSGYGRVSLFQMNDGFTGGEQLLVLKTDAGDRAQPALRKLEGGSGGRLSLAKPGCA